MKKMISFLAAFSMILTSAVASAPASVMAVSSGAAVSSGTKVGAYAQVDNMSFTIQNGKAELTSFSSVNAEEVTIPDTVKDCPVTSIESSAFLGCKKLRKIVLGKYMAECEGFSMDCENLEEIVVPEDNESLVMEDGILYTKDMKKVIACPAKTEKEDIVIPDEVESVGMAAFTHCASIKSVTIPDSVKEIWSYAFMFCEGLKSAKLPKDLEYVRANTFTGCSSLEKAELPEGLKYIELGAFSYCPVLKDINIPSAVEAIGVEAFYQSGCTVSEDGILYVGDWAVDVDLNVEAKNSPNKGKRFYSDIKDANIRVGTVGTAWGLLRDTPDLRSVVVPDTVKHIGEGMVTGIGIYVERVDFWCHTIPERSLICSGIKEVYIHDPDCVIEDSASSFPAYWRNIEEEMTVGRLKDIFEENVSSSGSAASSVHKAINTELIEIDEDSEDPEKELLERMGQNADEYYAKQKVYNAPIKQDGVARYDTVIHGFRGSAAEDYAIKYRRCFTAFVPASAAVGPEIFEENGIQYRIYGGAAAEAVLTDGGKLKSDITIPEEIKGVPVTGFRDYTDADTFAKFTVHLPKTVKTVEDSYSASENNIMYFDVSEDNPYICSVDGIVYSKDMKKLVKIPGCYNSVEIVIPDSVRIIDRYAGWALKNVEKIVIPEGTEIIKDSAFACSQKLASVKLPETLDTIGNGVFGMCSLLTDISIPDSVEQIGNNAFDMVPAAEHEKGGIYIGKWLVQTEASGERLVIREDTEGIATVDLYSDTVFPKSVKKVGWEMANGKYNKMERADVYSSVIDFDEFKNAKFMKDIYIYDRNCQICSGENTIPAKYVSVLSRDPADVQAYRASVTITELTRTVSERYGYYDEDELDDVVIHGYAGSTAEAYAKMYGRKFEVIDADSAYKNGDINGDAVLNVGDLVILNRYLHGTYQFTEKQFKSADLNGDGSVDVFDVIIYRRKLVE
ncbi:leucine-rich repeat protein [Ruminococcus flavefaciens]|uniref:leucine-rich repeat protein n=1 Tax=Ruminococcus flavefaciens TaxID=1265 RepID=UPI0002FE2A7F|nr:leucine-rich repeat protein [Ruminococcus flavefaciens]